VIIGQVQARTEFANQQTPRSISLGEDQANQALLTTQFGQDQRDVIFFQKRAEANSAVKGPEAFSTALSSTGRHQVADTASSAAKLDPNQTHILPSFPNRHERRRWISLGKPLLEYTFPLGKWQGQVLESLDDRFKAVLHDFNSSKVIDVAEFSFADISDDDRPLVRPGAVFYWYLLYHNTKTGRRERQSQIWFRRSGRMSQESYSETVEKVDEVWRTFGWSSDIGDSGATE
jgi:hypothetical protein